MSTLTHLDESGSAQMVDIGAKPVSARRARASGRITMRPETLEAIQAGNTPKGDVLSAARIAGIMAAKNTAALIPLCHPLGLDAVTIDFSFETSAIRVVGEASLSGKTGVEMEALVAVSTALLTIYDMAKALEKGMVIDQLRLLEKSGGQSGHWRAEQESA